MKRPLKLLGVLAAVLVLLAAAGALALRLFLPPEKVRELAVEKARGSLGRTLELSSVSIGLFRGVSLEGLRLSDRPDFAAGTFVEARSLSVRPRLSALLRGRLAVSGVSLDGLVVRLRRDAAGRSNFEDLLSSESSGLPPAALAFVLDQAALREGRVEWAEPGRRGSLSVAEARLSDFRVKGPFAWRLKAAFELVEGSRTLAGSFEGRGTADLAALAPEGLRFGLEEGTLGLGGARLELSADLAGLEPMEGALKAALEPVESEALSSLGLPPGLRLPELKVEARFRKEGGLVRVPSLRAELPGAVVAGSATYSAEGAKLELATKGAELGRLAAVHPSGRALAPEGTAGLFLLADWSPGDLWVRKLTADWSVKPIPLDRVKAAFPGAPVGLPALSGALEAGYRKERLTLKSLEAEAGPLKLSAGGSLGLAPGLPSTLQLSTNLFDLKAAAALVPGLDAYKPEGQARLEARLGGTREKPKLSGLASLAGAGGSYKGVSLAGVSASATLTEDSVSAPRVTGKLNGSEFRLALSARAGERPSAEVEGTIGVLDLGALLALAAPSAAAAPPKGSPEQAGPPAPALATKGRLEAGEVRHPNLQAGKAELAWSLSGVTPDLKSVGGTASLRVAAGRAVKVLELAKTKAGAALVAPLVALERARGLPGVSLPSLDEIPFDRIVGDYAAEKGVLTIRPFRMEGPTVAFDSDGAVDLPAQTVDLKVRLAVGSVRPHLLVKGPAASPAVSLDASKVKEQAADLLMKEGEKLLRGLFK